MKRLWECLLPESKPLRLFLFCLLVYSFLVPICAVVLDYHHSPTEALLDYRPYFRKLNWVLFPLFFLIVGIVVKYTWKPFEEAWERSGNTPDSIIKDSSGKAIGKKQTEALISRLNKQRNWCLGIGLIASSIMWFFDSAETRHIYCSAKDYEEQLEYASKDPDFTVKWLFEQKSVEQNAPFLPAPMKQVIFTLMVELQQVFLIGLGFLVLFQIILQTFWFAALDLCRLNGVTYSIRLDPRSPSNDFGLVDWNKALDTTYWFIAPSLLMPIISMLSQPSDDRDIGQVMGIGLVGVLILIPPIITILGRRRWLYECQRRLEESGHEEQTWEQYHQQKLWPMGRQRMEQIGLLLCLFLFVFYAGVEITKYVKF